MTEFSDCFIYIALFDYSIALGVRALLLFFFSAGVAYMRNFCLRYFVLIVLGHRARKQKRQESNHRASHLLLAHHAATKQL